MGDFIFIPGIRTALKGDMKEIKAWVLGKGREEIRLMIAALTEDEKRIIETGCLINYNRERNRNKAGAAKEFLKETVDDYCEQA